MPPPPPGTSPQSESKGAPIRVPRAAKLGETFDWHRSWNISVRDRIARHKIGVAFEFSLERVKAMRLPSPPHEYLTPDRVWRCRFQGGTDKVEAYLTGGRTERSRLLRMQRLERLCLEACQLYSERARWLCLDCALDTLESGDYYMVTEGLWQQAQQNLEGMLCLDCLQERIRRPLEGNDFIDCYVNDHNNRVRALRGQPKLTEIKNDAG